MGLFNFGGSKSTATSSSKSSSSSFDNLDQFGLNMGGSESSQDIAFKEIFANLFGGAAATAAGVDTSAISGAANMLFSSGTNFLDSISGGGPGAEYLNDQLAGSGSLVDEQISLLNSDLKEFLNESILPSIKSEGVATMGLGGGRGEVAKGLAAEGMLEEFARGAVGIRQGERDRLTGIAGGLMADDLARNQAGLAALPGLFGLAEAGGMASLSPYMALSQIVGGPTVLGSSSSYDFGIDSTTGRARSSSSSSSTSSQKSKSFSMGWG